MKKIFVLFILLSGIAAKAQYTNSWIDHSKTYYKFKVGATGVYRISGAQLSSLGLGDIPVEQFQLWRNGEEVPMYSSIASGTLGAGDFLEFWGVRNDGKMDTRLYREARFQQSDRHSLFTDSAAFFLTVNPGPNKRFVQQTYSLTNLPEKEKYFIYTFDTTFRNQINPGIYASVGQRVYSSAFDQGEMWTSANIGPNASLNLSIANMSVASEGPDASLLVSAAGNSQKIRSVALSVNGNEFYQQLMDYFADSTFRVASIPRSILTATTTVSVANRGTESGDQMVVSRIALTYPRLFSFSNLRNFEFTLEASATPKYLEINNFTHNAVAPVIYDLTNLERYPVDISTPGTFKVLLNPSPTPRRLVMVSQAPVNLRPVTFIQTRKFRDYRQAANQGNYLIITSPIIYNGEAGNPVEKYRDYRNSVAGGSFNANIYDVTELEDQFAYGILKHPISIKEFLRFARENFSSPLQNVLLIGRGMTYSEFHPRQNNNAAHILNQVPTFGYPGSDNFLASNDMRNAIPATPIGRLAAVDAQEVESYLNKVKEYELVQKTPSCSIADKAWMKNVVQVTGASDADLGTLLCNYMDNYRGIITDTGSFGAKVTTFCKRTTSVGGQDAASARLAELFEEGMSALTYFGHSSATVLEFSISDPENYNNTGKYPVFFVNGCSAGNFFNWNATRTTGGMNLTEKFVLTPNKGSIAFVASTSYGIVSYLNVYVNGLYKLITKNDYRATLGQSHIDAMKNILDRTGLDDLMGRMHSEQITLHGDPAIYMNTFDKPDYNIEDAQIKLSPNFLTIAENKFDLKVRLFNTGKAISDSVRVHVVRRLPDDRTDTLFNEKIAGIRALDSLHFVVPIVATTDKGMNKIIVTIDPDNEFDELCESNNSVTKEFMIYGDDARPVYPYAYAIVNQPVDKFMASTSDPFGKLISYKIQVDTTELFNSPILVSQTISSTGGLLEFTPSVTWLDSTVYYWRTAVVPQDGSEEKWSVSSFLYLTNSTSGWSQAHYYQFKRNWYDQVELMPDRKLKFDVRDLALKVSQGVYPNLAPEIFLNDESLVVGGCGTYLNSIGHMLINKSTGRQINNATVGTVGKYGSLNPLCPDNGILGRNTFFFYYNNPTWRDKARDFLDSVPNNTLILIWNWGSTGYNSNPEFIDKWINDRQGGNTALYDVYKNLGLHAIDSFYHNVPFYFLLEKDEQGVLKVLHQEAGEDGLSTFVARHNFERLLSNGVIKGVETSASGEWKSIHWDSEYGGAEPDESVFRLYGIRSDFSESLLYESGDLRKDTTLDFVDPNIYKTLRLELHQNSTVTHIPRQLKYWRIVHDEVPEGALSANNYFSTRDTVEIGEQIDFKIAFKNISKTDFAKLKAKLIVIDNNNVSRDMGLQDLDELPAGQTDTLNIRIDTRQFPGNNTLFLDINPDNDQAEQYHFNNFLYRDLYVKPDQTNPLMDVTFDGQHILNRDIVSSKPLITIKLKDEAKYMPLVDKENILVTLKYLESGGWTRTYTVDEDTLRFTPPTDANNDNTAVFEFRPHLLQDGEYEMTVKGKDASNNIAGSSEYKVNFQTYNKPMISNMLNYPNPFTTSTAFVFTLTGSEIPQNIRIQIMTITGKIVREITKDELGPIRIGRNITEFKWDGTDQYGQKLANGIYLYRVITSLNGNSMEKFKAESDKTDKFFNQGYGKMYLMR